MRENVPLLKCNGLRSGPGAIQREFHRSKRGAGMLLSYCYVRLGSTNTGCGDGITPGCRHFFSFAKSPERAVQWPHVGKEDWLRRILQEPFQVSVVLSLLFQNLRIPVGLRGPCYRGWVSCWRACGLGVFIDAPRRSAERDQQAEGKRKPVPLVLLSHSSMVCNPAAQNNNGIDL